MADDCDHRSVLGKRKSDLETMALFAPVIEDPRFEANAECDVELVRPLMAS